MEAFVQIASKGRIHIWAKYIILHQLVLAQGQKINSAQYKFPYKVTGVLLCDDKKILNSILIRNSPATSNISIFAALNHFYPAAATHLERNAANCRHSLTCTALLQEALW